MKKELMILGGGPGGYVAAIRAAQRGIKVTLIENKDIGGTCLNRGCIPTKALLKSASLLEQIKSMRSYGITVNNVEFDFNKTMQWKDRVVKRLTGGVGSLLDKNGVEVLYGTAKFIGSDTIDIDGEQIQFEKAIIATGSESAKPPIPGIEGENVIFSNDALSLKELPTSLGIIGGGVIGVELANVFAATGTKVTVIEALQDIVPVMDKDLGKNLEKALKKKGIKIYTGAKVTGICSDRIKIDNKGKEEEIFCEKVLVAVGRRPNTEGLCLETANIMYDRKGIQVNERMETNVPGIYAVGDVVPTPQLAHVASEEGLVAVDNILGNKSWMKYNAVPYCVYTNPELAAVGLTEDIAKDKGIEYSIGTFPLMINGKAMIEGVREGFVKIIADKNDNKILGVHIMAPHACEIIQQACVAITLGATLDQFEEVINPHPTMGETMFEAALLVKGKGIHI